MIDNAARPRYPKLRYKAFPASYFVVAEASHLLLDGTSSEEEEKTLLIPFVFAPFLVRALCRFFFSWHYFVITAV